MAHRSMSAETRFRLRMPPCRPTPEFEVEHLNTEWSNLIMTVECNR
jgi:hypothetical protein